MGSLRVLAVLLASGCNAAAGLDDLQFTAGPSATTVGAGGAAGAASTGGRIGEGGEGGLGCVPSVGPRRVFVTSDFWNVEELGGVSGADAHCQDAAENAALVGCWRAWISDATVGAAERLCPGGGWQRLDGQSVAADCTQLLDGTLDLPIDLTETNVHVSVGVWTGTSASGTATFHCQSWRSSAQSELGTQGSSDSTGAEWSSGFRTACLDVGALYCFEQ